MIVFKASQIRFLMKIGTRPIRQPWGLEIAQVTRVSLPVRHSMPGDNKNSYSPHWSLWLQVMSESG